MPQEIDINRLIPAAAQQINPFEMLSGLMGLALQQQKLESETARDPAEIAYLQAQAEHLGNLSQQAQGQLALDTRKQEFMETAGLEDLALRSRQLGQQMDIANMTLEGRREDAVLGALSAWIARMLEPRQMFTDQGWMWGTPPVSPQQMETVEGLGMPFFGPGLSSLFPGAMAPPQSAPMTKFEPGLQGVEEHPIIKQGR